MSKRVGLWGLGLSCCLLALSCGDDVGKPSGDAGPSDAAAADGGGNAPCTDDSDCDDDLFCTGQETCKAGKCLAGKAMECDDGIACTQDRCSEKKRACEYLPVDSDGDGHYDARCKDDAGKTLGDDCDDSDPLRFPGNIETCDPDNRDDDCDPKTFGEKDSDNDSFFDAKCCNPSAEGSQKLNCGNDCDDLKPSVNPNAAEICDLYDNNCNGKTDEGVSVKLYPDKDFDGHGANGGKAVDACPGTVGLAAKQNDCNDDDSEVFVGEFEICDGKDNNCNKKIDEVEEDAPWFLDEDKDGFGDATSTPVYSCQRIPGRVLSNSDCDDNKAAVNPAQAELCDGVDNDCSGRKDFKLATNDFEDDDNDGVPDAKCGAGANDCDDLDPTTAKGMEEVCDMRDNDCDDSIDEETAQTVWYLDQDGDGWGIDQGTALARCEPIPGRSPNLGDCDDEENSIHPTALETCNGTDDNCNGTKDEGADYQCDAQNGIGFCKNGGCAVLSCFPGFADTDLSAANGCEMVVPVVPLANPASCNLDADCNDNNYCNGKEHCIVNAGVGACYAGTPVNCSASTNVLQGSFFIHNSLDIATLKGVETITGDLTISAPGLLNLIGLESLKTIGGSLIVDGGSLPTGSNTLQALVGSGLINLTTCGGDITISNNESLTVIRLPSLVTANSITITNNAALTTLDGFDDLVAVKEQIDIENNPALTTLSGMQALQRVGSLHVANNQLKALKLAALDRAYGNDDAESNWTILIAGLIDQLGQDPLASVSFPKLTRVDGTLRIQNLPLLKTVSAPLLKRIYGDLDLESLGLLDNPDFHSLAQMGPDMIDNNLENYPYLTLQSNPALKSLDKLGAKKLSAPGGQGYININSNTQLTTCEIADFAMRVDPSFFLNQSNNNTGQGDGGVSVCQIVIGTGPPIDLPPKQ